MGHCKVCSERLEHIILNYENTPKQVQNLPDELTVSSDTGISLLVYQCLSCGTIQLDIDPVYYYRDVIRAAAVSSELIESKKQQFSEFISRFNLQNKTILEVGCGNGEFLTVLCQCGVNAFGIENSAEAFAVCRKNGLAVYKGFIDRKEYLLDKKFDGFIMLNYLEHLPNPADTLKGIASNLGEGAYGIVEVPNSDMLFAENLHSEFMLDHQLYFTKKTLVNLLEICGFDVVECNVLRYGYILSAIVKKLEPRDSRMMTEQKDTISRLLEALLYDIGQGAVAVWGASHQAFFILSQLESSSRISFVIDSAKMKQGKYTPVSHIPIKAPEDINFQDISAIIVMAASYSDEVVRILKDKHEFNKELYVLRAWGLEKIN